MAISYSPSGTASLDDFKTAIEAEIGANIDAEESARIAGDNALQANIDSEESARIAGDNALQSQVTANDTDIANLFGIAIHTDDRPGDNHGRFTVTQVGDGDDRTPLGSGGVVTNDLGKVYSLTGAGYVLRRDPVALSQDVWEVMARVRRETDPADKSNHTAELVVMWLNNEKTIISEVALQPETNLLVSDGLVEMSARVSTVPGTVGAVVPPAPAVYMTVGVKQYGEDGVLSVETVRARLLNDIELTNGIDWSQLQSDVQAATTAASNAAALVNTEVLDGWADVTTYSAPVGTGAIQLRYGAAEHDGLGGLWVKDTADTTSTHNPPEVLVSSDGSRFRPARNYFASVADILATTTPYPVGSILVAEAESIAFEAVASSAPDNHTITSGSTKLKITNGPHGFAVPQELPITQEIVDSAMASAGALPGRTTETNVNAPWVFRANGILTLPPGDYDAPDVLSRVSGQDKLVIHGASAGSTRILIPDGQYFMEDSLDPQQLDVRGIHFVGGKGAFHFTKDSGSARGFYDIHHCVFSDFTEAAFASENPDFGRFNITRNFFWARGTDDTDLTGIAIALAGWADNSQIDYNIIHKARYGVKLGRPAVFWVTRNSFLRVPGMTAGTYTPIWIVPEAGAQLIGGTRIAENRFGNENMSGDDYHIIVADEDAASGTDFATRGHSTDPSTGVARGLIIENNWAAGSSNRTFVTSWTPNLRNCHIGNELLGNMPGEISLAPGVSVNRQPFYHRSNTVTTDHTYDTTDALVQPPPFLFKIRDTGNLYSGADGVEQLHPGGLDPDWEEALSPDKAHGSSADTTVTSAADAYGGDNARAVNFGGDDKLFTALQGRVFYSFTVPAGQENRLHFVEIEVQQAATLPMEFIGISMREGAASRMRSVQRIPAGTSRWSTIRLPWLPGASGSYTLNVHANGYVSGSVENVVVGRPRVYAGHSPVNYGHNGPTGGRWNEPHWVQGGRHEWVDSSGNKRANIGAPTSDTDGTIISAAAVV